jgi:hypothetical protein
MLKRRCALLATIAVSAGGVASVIGALAPAAQSQPTPYGYCYGIRPGSSLPYPVYSAGEFQAMVNRGYKCGTT